MTIQFLDSINVDGDATVSGNATVTGNLTVSGSTTTVDSTTVTHADGMIKLAKGNAADATDAGVYIEYVVGGTTKWSGSFRDASDSGKVKFFKDLESEPTTTVDTGHVSYAANGLVALDFELPDGQSLEDVVQAPVITTAASAAHDNERVLTAGLGISLVDAGAGSTITVAQDINGLAVIAPAAADSIAFYDDSGSTIGKTTITVLAGAIDHGAVAGLADDDHTQYALLLGRATGQTIIGGTASGDDLTLKSTSNAVPGDVILDANTGVILTPHGTAAGSTQALQFRELAANGTNVTGLKSADSVAASLDYVLPAAAPTVSGQVLSATTAGVMSWATSSGGRTSYKETFGNGAATSFSITHSLATQDVGVHVYKVSDGAEVHPTVVRTSTNVVTLTFNTAPTTNQYRVVVIDLS